MADFSLPFAENNTAAHASHAVNALAEACTALGSPSQWQKCETVVRTRIHQKYTRKHQGCTRIHQGYTGIQQDAPG
jgi:hypothetical protein